MSPEVHQGPLTEAQAAVVKLLDRGDQDDHSDLLSMPTGLPRPMHDGMPIPYTTDIEWFSGRPRWKQNNAARRLHCVLNRRCGLCGDPLGLEAAVLGNGDVSRYSASVDRVAMHPACLKVTLARCPGLALHLATLRWWIEPTIRLVIGGRGETRYFLVPDRKPDGLPACPFAPSSSPVSQSTQEPQP